MHALVVDLDPVSHLEAELSWLDAVLRAAVRRQRAEGRWRGDDDLRGVHVSGETAASVLDGRPTAAAAGRPAVDQRSRLDHRLRLPGAGALPLVALWENFGLDPFERFVLLLALAPELDRRYATVLGYLRDDASAATPTVALAIDLWLGPGPASGRLRRAFRPDATLRRYELVRLRPPAAGRSLLGHMLEVDDWVVDWTLQESVPEHPAADDLETGGEVLVVVADDRRSALDAVGSGALDVTEEGREPLVVAARRARAENLVLVIAGERLGDDDLDLLDAFCRDHLRVVVTIDAGEVDRLPSHWPRRHLPPTTASVRAARWRAALVAADLSFEEGAIAEAAGSHPIALDRIDAAVQRLVAGSAPAPPLGRRPLGTVDLRRAARSVARHRLAGLARRVPAGRSWDDLVLPRRTLLQLHEIAAAVAHRAEVLDDWGFGARAGGRGVHVLFSGSSGTGKTLAAGVIAEEAGYELYVVDLARVVDKYLGETEKQLDRVFTEAGAAGAVLLFDEADALFGQRAQVHDARDRWANLEVAFLLQRLEDHEGVTILATNLGQHLDPAFTRRLHHRVEFPLPDEELRRQLWRSVLPDGAPLDDDLDLDLIGSRFELSGGAIRNAALTAAYLAAAAGRPIALADVVRAVARELEKSGQPATRAEFRELHDVLVAAGGHR